MNSCWFGGIVVVDDVDVVVVVDVVVDVGLVAEQVRLIPPLPVH